MRANYRMRSRQRGAVAVIMGIAAVVLFAFMGISVDLAYTYSRKTELQNAADAAALSGAKELNEKAAGVTAAIAKAIATFNQNNINNFVGSSFVITVADLRLGSCPNADDRLPLRSPNCTFVAASSVTTDAAAAGKTFLEVATPSQTRNTFFMLVTGSANASTSTFGYAVAGRFVNDVTPIGVCAIDPVNKTNKYIYDFPAGTSEIVEAGFRRGVTYNIFNLNPLGGAVSDPYLLNPVDVPPSCDPSHSSAAFTGPFVCTGSSAVVSGGAISVNTNTGYSTGPIEAALNSRFDSFGGPSPCDPATAPPDSNVKEYHCTGVLTDCLAPPPLGSPQDWIDPVPLSTAPNQESVQVNSNNAILGSGYVGNPRNKPVYALPPANNAAQFMPNQPTTNNPPLGSAVTFQQYGALWSYGPAYQADASTPPKAGLPFTPAVANTVKLYDNPSVGPPTQYFDVANYPLLPGTGFPLTIPAAPYNQTAGNYFQAPPTHPPGTRNRRILNLVIVDCRNPPVGSAACGVMPVVGVGKFFMQTPAVFTGGPASRRLMVEFAGLIEPVPVSEVKLFR
ncbi:MAG TPA: pilus assembly protein TadG-related protein [Casimicrobiaceae bacterium]|nr:pilus assembly protein TadG-related protein [Casimicrobiaceae bacterium]